MTFIDDSRGPGPPSTPAGTGFVPPAGSLMDRLSALDPERSEPKPPPVPQTFTPPPGSLMDRISHLDPYPDEPVVGFAEPKAPAVSQAGTLLHLIERGVIPTLTGAPPAFVGAMAGAAAGVPLDPFTFGGASVVAAIIGGAIGGLGGSYVGDVAQEYGLGKLDPDAVKALGQDAETRRAETEAYPKTAFVGGLLPNLLFMRPGASVTKALPEGASAVSKWLAKPLPGRLLGSTIFSSLEAGQEYATEGEIDPAKVAMAGAFGGLANKPTRLTEIGEKAVHRAFGLPTGEVAPEAAPQPAPEPSASAQAQPETPAESPAVAPPPQEAPPAATPEAPDVHAVARTIAPDTFREYDELTARRATFRNWLENVPQGEPIRPDMAKVARDIRETESRLRELAPDVADAYRKAGEQMPAAEPAAPPAPPSREEYVAKAMDNLRGTSRTVAGTLDLSSTPGKAERMAEGLTAEGAAQSATQNFENVIRDLHARKDNLPATAEGMAPFIDDVARRVNEGIVKPEALDRVADTKFPNQTAAADLPAAKAQFAEELTRRLNDPKADPVETAAWIEWRANLMDHFWSDGVGKTSKALAAVPLMRAGLPLPTYPPNKTIFNFTKGVAPRDYSGPAWDKFNAYYHQMVDPKGSLRAMLDRGAPLDELVQHPYVQHIDEQNKRAIPTGTPEDFVNPEWRAARTYDFNGEKVQGWDGGVERLTDQARAYAGPEGVANERHAVIILGPPAAGKSSIANPIARKFRAAVVDADDAKLPIQEYRGGVGTAAVHEESSFLAKDVMLNIFAEGGNIVLPKVGDNAAKIGKMIAGLKEEGYKVDLVHTAATPEISGRRNIKRMLDTGRLVPPEYIAQVGDKPHQSYHLNKGKADDFLDVDTSREPARIVEGSGPLADAVGNGRDVGRLGPGGAQGPQGPAEEGGEAQVGAPSFIAQDVTQKLIAAGRSSEEAHAYGALHQILWETYAARFKGRKGTAEEVYRREAPGIEGFARRAPAVAEPGAPVVPADETLPPLLRAAPLPSSLPNNVQTFAPGDLLVDARRFQFKDGGDEAGVTDRLKGVTRWDPVKAGMVLVWQDRSGQNFIVDGHQRHALATRIAKVDPAQKPELLARVVREADGVSDADVRVMAAAKNIAEGTGTAVDAAKVLRERPDLIGDLPPRSELVRQARGLVNLSDDAFRMIVNDVVPPSQGAIVGRLVPGDPQMQAALIDLLAKTEPANAVQAEAIVRQGIEAGVARREKGAQASLFGEDDIATSLYLDRAKVLDKALAEIRRDKRVFSVLTKEQETIEASGNKLAADINQKRAAADATALQVLQTLASRRGPVSEALGRAAGRARADGKPGLAVRGFVHDIRGLVESGDLARLADGIERGPTHVGAEDTAGAVEFAPERGSGGAERRADAEAGSVIEEAKTPQGEAPEREAAQRALFQRESAKTLSPEQVERVWDDDKLLSRVIRRMKFDDDHLEETISKVSDVAGDMEHNLDQIKAITPEDRAALKPDEEFIAEEELAAARERAPELVVELRESIRDVANRAANMLGSKEIGEHEYEPAQLADDDLAALEKLVYRQRDPSTNEWKWGLADDAADVSRAAEEIESEVDYGTDDGVETARADLRVALEHLYDRSTAVIAEIDARLKKAWEAESASDRVLFQRSLMREREAQGQMGFLGTERVSDRELAQRRADAPLRPSVEQKPMEEGLFGGGAAQKELFQRGERIAFPAVKARRDGMVFLGMNHGDAAEKAGSAGHDLNTVDDGFLTSEGRFVDRKEANSIADGAGQINPDVEARGNYLMTHQVLGEQATRAQERMQDSGLEMFQRDRIGRNNVLQREDIEQDLAEGRITPQEAANRRARLARNYAGQLRVSESMQDHDLARLELFQRNIAPPFYSAVERAVTSAKQDKASPEQWLGMLKNMPGVKPEEMQWLGLEEWLREQKGSITKAQIADYVRANRIEVKEVTKGGLTSEQLARGEVRGGDDPNYPFDILVDGQVVQRAATREQAERELHSEIDMRTPRGERSAAKFSSYTLPGGENYRELLLTLPEKSPEGMGRDFYNTMPNNAVAWEDLPTATKETFMRTAPQKAATFRSSHWDEPNVLAHVRFNDRVIDGKKTLLVEEVQSDWGQKLRHSLPLRQLRKPDSVRELGENFFGRELASTIPLKEVDGGVLALAHHDQVANSIASLLPVDVVDKLGGLEGATKKISGNPSVVFNLFPADRRATVAKVVLDAARQVFTEARTKLADGFKTGRDVEILPALRASQLTAREIVGMLSPESLYHMGLPGKAVGLDVALGGTEEAAAGGLAERDAKGLPATDAKFLNSSLSTDGGAVPTPRGFTGPDGKPLPAIVAEALDWHNKLLTETGASRPVEYRASDIPSMPFGTTWHELALKRMIRYAAENGYDKIAWTSGETQAARYDLSKQVERINVTKESNGTFTLDAVTNAGRPVALGETVKQEGLADIVGKELAEKIAAQAEDQKSYTGLDLKVGGEGMRGFYDQILPATVNKLVKKFGGKVEDATMLVPQSKEATIPDREKSVHTLDITSSLRDAAVEHGFPLFQQGDIKRGKIRLMFGTALRNIITMLQHANASTFLHETGHDWLARLLRDAEDHDAPEDLKADAKTVLRWFGVGSADEVKKQHHEQFANGFLNYFMEGIAPSRAIAAVFGKFRDWLLKIYRTVADPTGYQGLVASAKRGEVIPLNDEMRGVYERLLAIDPERITIAPDIETGGPHTEEMKAKADAELARIVGEHGEGRAAGVAPPTAPAEGGPEAKTSPPPPEPGYNPVIKNAPPENPTARFDSEKAGNIRLENVPMADIKDPQAFQDVIRQSAGRNNNFQEWRQPMTDAEAFRLGEALALDPAFLDRKQIGDAWTKPEIMGIEILLNRSGAAVKDAAAKAVASGSAEDALAYEQEKARLIMMHDTVQGKASGARHMAGQTLQGYAALAKMSARVAGTDAGKILEETGRTLFQSQREARFASRLKTPQQVGKWARDSIAEDFHNRLVFYYVNALISGPITHFRYAVGNAINAIERPLIEIPIAAAYGAARETLGYERAADRVFIGEAGAQLYGLFKGSRDGMSAAVDAFTSGVSPPLPGERLMHDISLAQPAARTALGRAATTALSVPGRSVAGIHSFFKSVRYEQEIQGLAYRTATREGLTDDTKAARIAELTTTPTPAMMDAATKTALRELYMAPTDYHSAMGALIRFTNRSLLAKIVVPFMKIGSQITRQAFLERTPLAFADKEARANLTMQGGTPADLMGGGVGPGAAFDMQAAKITAGVSLMGATVLMAAEGMITGDGPSDPDRRRVWLLNHRPNTMQIGNITIPFQGLGHLGMLTRFSANMYDVAHAIDAEEDWSKVAASFFHGLSDSVLDENFMRGVKDMLDALYHPEEYGEAYVRQFATNWLPFSVGLGQVARESDPFQREVHTIFEAAQAKVPGYREQLLPKRDMFGEPIGTGGLLTAGREAAPTEAQRYANDPVVKAMDALQIGIAPLPRKIAGIKLSDEQYDDFARVAGRMTKVVLDELVAQPGFNSIPPGERIDMIHKIITTQRAGAANFIKAQYAQDIVTKALAAKAAKFAPAPEAAR